jgi:hypothetical protein
VNLPIDSEVEYVAVPINRTSNIGKMFRSAFGF